MSNSHQFELISRFQLVFYLLLGISWNKISSTCWLIWLNSLLSKSSTRICIFSSGRFLIDCAFTCFTLSTSDARPLLLSFLTLPQNSSFISFVTRSCDTMALSSSILDGTPPLVTLTTSSRSFSYTWRWVAVLLLARGATTGRALADIGSTRVVKPYWLLNFWSSLRVNFSWRSAIL